jgi:GT2 family glycosyltransferase
MVDNGSSDESIYFTEKNFPEVRIVKLPDNQGFVGAVNAGIEAAEGEFVSLLNNDTKVDSHWLEELVKTLEAHPECGSATSKILQMRDGKTFDGAGDMQNWYFIPFPRGRDTIDTGQFDDEAYVFSASGAACLYRKSMLDEIGLLDSSFFAYYEDVDLGYRAQLAGYKCIYTPKAKILHDVGGTSKIETDFVYFHPMKNRWFMILKNTPASLLWMHAHKILISEGLFWVRALRRHKVRALVRAYREVLKSLPRLRRERREIKQLKKISNSELHRLILEKYPPPPRKLLRFLQ